MYVCVRIISVSLILFAWSFLFIYYNFSCLYSQIAVFICIQHFSILNYRFQLSALFFFCPPSGSMKNIENLLNAGGEEWMVMVFPVPKEPDLQMLLMKPQPVS